MRLLRYIYSALVYLVLPFAFIRLWWRGRHNIRYRQGWRMRMGYVTYTGHLAPLWIHAASLGEVIAAEILLRRWMATYPEVPVWITTMTISGAEEVHKRFGDKVQHSYVPYDVPTAVQRFIKTIKPMAVVLIETELWPNLLYGCQQARVPALLANARLSARSYAGYRRVNVLFKSLWPSLYVAAQTKIEAERFIALGVPETQVSVTGSLKFDLQLNPHDFERATYFRDIFGRRQAIWLAASTHEGEEAIILDAFIKVKQALPDVLLVIAPRHRERFDVVAALIEARGLSIARRSLEQVAKADTDVFLQDSMGELLHSYGAVDLAYVGGSLVPIGGHNVLEPAAFAVPALTGPHVFNFLEITQMLTEANALETVTDADSIAAAVTAAFTHPDERIARGERARQVVAANRGAVLKQLDMLAALTNAS